MAHMALFIEDGVPIALRKRPQSMTNPPSLYDYNTFVDWFTDSSVTLNIQPANWYYNATSTLSTDLKTLKYYLYGPVGFSTT